MVDTKAMRVDNGQQKDAQFEIKDNVLIGKEIEFPESYLNAGEIILEIFKSKPDFVGQIEATTGKRCTYKEMMDKSVRCAIWLRKNGVKPGDTVAVSAFAHLDAYVPFLASLYIGATCAVEHHKLPLRAFNHFLSMVTPKVIFLHAYDVQNFNSSRNELNMDVQRVVFEDGIATETSLDEILSAQTASEVKEFRCANIENPKETALLIGTSGSTGMPKVAELSHLSLRTLLHPAYTSELLNRVAMSTSSVRWIPYFMLLLSALRSDSTRIIVDDEKDGKFYCDVIKKYKVEYYLSDSNRLREIYKLGLIDDYKATNLKSIVFGGSPFSRELHETFIKLLPRINIYQCYGSTDMGGRVTQQVRGCKPGSCGFIFTGVKVKIVCTETDKTLGPNKHGEIYVQASSQMNGYRNNPQVTKNTVDSEGWLRTHDIGYYDEDGEIYIVGRTSDFIKYKDCSLSIVELESTLDTHPAVSKAAVVPRYTDIEGEVPIAVVAKVPGKQVTEEELITYCRENMPGFYILGGVKFINALPYTDTRKIARNTLKQMVQNGLI